MENNITFTHHLSEDSHYPYLPQIARELSATPHRATIPGGPSRERPLPREHPLLPEGTSPRKSEAAGKGKKSQIPYPNSTRGTQMTLRKEGTGRSNSTLGARDNPQPPPQEEGQQRLGPSQGHPAATKISRNIRVTQINLHKSHEAWDDIITCNETRSQIILAQEPPIIDQKSNRVKASGGFSALYDKRAKERPRATILINKNLGRNVFLLDKFTDRDTVTILVKLGTKSVILCSMYMDRELECPPKLLGELAAHAKRNNLKLVIGSDTNAHNTSWGMVTDRIAKNRGDSLLEAIVDLDLHISNVNCPHTYDNGHRKNVLDLTMTNNQALDMIQDWQTIVGKCRSDHVPITFVLRDMDGSKIRSFYNIKKTNWALYRQLVEKGLEETGLKDMVISNTEELETANEKLVELMLWAYYKSTPKTYVSAHSKDPPWLSGEVKAAREEMFEKLRHAQTTKVRQDWDSANKARNKYTKVKNQSKVKNWKIWAEDLDAYADAQKASQLLKNSKDYNLGCIFDANGDLSQSPKETLQIMAEVHFGEDHSTRPSLENKTEAPNGKWSDENTFSKTRIMKALREFKPLTAAGPDGIRPIMMQKVADIIAEPFAKIAKASYRLGVTPKSWQEAEAIYLPKPGKDDYRMPKSFRTITLASNLHKLMERLILWHIEVDQKVHKKLNRSQYGFRRGVSTETALHKVVRKIEGTLMHKGIALGTFLDIEGAFDNVAFQAMERALHAKLRDKRTAVWITYMISNREITTNLMEESLTIRATRGCPQGGILSPFLWNLVMDDLLNHSKKDIPGDLQGFADDLCLIVATQMPAGKNGPSEDILPLRDATQKGLNAINAWCKTVGLKLSALKSHIVIFTHRKKVKIGDPVKIEGNPIEVTQSTKFLGITLDNKLNWNEHVNKQIKKAKNILMQCRKVVGPTWGLNPKTALWIYTAIVRPTLCYGAMVWANAMRTKTNQENIARVQRLALKMVTGAMPSTASTALDTITNTIPITDHLRYCAVKTAYTLMVTGEWEGPIKSDLKNPKVFTSHANTVSRDFGTLEAEGRIHDLTTPELTLDRKFSLEIPERDTFVEDGDKYTIVAYTDGSKINNNAGAGYIIHAGETEIARNSHNLGPDGTVPAAEMYAIQQTAQYLLDRGTSNERIIINCDSQGTIKTLDSTTCRSRTTIKTIRHLNTLAIYNDVMIRWIPAHQGYDGNEMADILAKKGAQEIEEITLIPIPKAAAYAALRNKVKTGPIKHTEHMELMWTERYEKILPKLNRTDLRAATHLLTGHCHLNYHMKKLGKVNTTICEACKLEEETVKHVLTECPALWRLRQETFDRLGLSMYEIRHHQPLRRTISFYKKAMAILHPPETTP